MKKYSLKDRLFQVGFTIIVGIMAFIPAYFFLFLKSILSPEGFWQKFLVYGLGIWFLGAIQIVLIILALVLIIKVWTDF